MDSGRSGVGATKKAQTGLIESQRVIERFALTAMLRALGVDGGATVGESFRTESKQHPWTNWCSRQEKTLTSDINS